MRPGLPIIPAPRHASGAAWLSRAAVVSAALWLVLLGAAIGAAFATWGAWQEVRSHRFIDLGFQRSTFLFLEEAADDGALAGAQTALWFLIGALLVSAWAPVRALFDPRELHLMLRSPERLLRAQVAIALAFLVAIFALAYTGDGLKR